MHSESVPRSGSKATLKKLMTVFFVVVVFQGPLTSGVLRYLAGYLGKEWKDLASHLNLKPMRIQAILRQNVNKDTPQTRFDMLMAWAKRVPRSVDKVGIALWALVITRPIPYLHQTSSVLRKSPLELLSVLLE